MTPSPQPSPPRGEGGRVADPRQPVFAIDHDIQNRTPVNLAKYARIEAFAREHGIDFYPAGTGISHQVMVEQGYAIPGSMVVGSDSHSNLYGAVCCLGTPIVRTDAACLWATGTTWWRVPPVARCTLLGRLRPGVTGKDVIIALCGLFNHDEVLNHAVEFTGPGVATLSMDQRMSIANMTTEWGALAGVFPFDDVLRQFLYERADDFQRGRRPGIRQPGSLAGFTRDDVDRWWQADGSHPGGDGDTTGREPSARDDDVPDGCRFDADPDAAYAVELELDLSSIVPNVCGPNEVKTMHPLPEIESRRIRIDKAYLVSCVNARFEDLAQAADVVRGRRVARGVEFYVAAASAQVQARAESSGHWGALLDAGAIPLPPGCGPCIGLGRGLVEAGQVAISATNRNFKGRMGSRDAEVYLGSPAVVAASAVAGYICAPTRFEQTGVRASVKIRQHDGQDARPTQTRPTGGQKVIGGFPERIAGRVLLLPRDNLNTDGIYAGTWTYKDDMTPERMAGVAFENYDPRFNETYKPGDIIVSGRNFGSGSSREQAATCLKFKGVPCVVAASFSETYRRNAFNNGFLCIECPGLVDHLLGTLAGESHAGSLSIAGPILEIDLGASLMRCDGVEFAFARLSPVAQELIAAGGAEALARANV